MLMEISIQQGTAVTCRHILVDNSSDYNKSSDAWTEKVEHTHPSVDHDGLGRPRAAVCTLQYLDL